MKLTFVFCAFLAVVSSIPYRDQIALLNSLEVGRKEEPEVWQCFGCDQATKPIHSNIIQEPVKDVKAILSVYEEYSVLAFRYTATIKNVFQDIIYAIQTQDQHACNGCKVQKQYDKMWNSIRDQTIDHLRKHNHTSRLIITGISLGGGLAVLSYVDIAKSGLFDNIEVITFGAPRVGNKKWAEWFDQQTQSTRYYIKGDPIAVLPICFTLLCNYQQTGTPIECNKNNEFCSLLSKGEEETGLKIADISQNLISAILEHEKEEECVIGGLISHITGYKKIKEYEYSE